MRNYKKYVRILQLQFVLLVLGNLTDKRERGQLDVILIFIQPEEARHRC